MNVVPLAVMGPVKPMNAASNGPVKAYMSALLPTDVCAGLQTAPGLMSQSPWQSEVTRCVSHFRHIL